MIGSSLGLRGSIDSFTTACVSNSSGQNTVVSTFLPTMVAIPCTASPSPPSKTQFPALHCETARWKRPCETATLCTVRCSRSSSFSAEKLLPSTSTSIPGFTVPLNTRPSATKSLASGVGNIFTTWITSGPFGSQRFIAWHTSESSSPFQHRRTFRSAPAIGDGTTSTIESTTPPWPPNHALSTSFSSGNASIRSCSFVSETPRSRRKGARSAVSAPRTRA